jgi:hypothetical protein
MRVVLLSTLLFISQVSAQSFFKKHSLSYAKDTQLQPYELHLKSLLKEIVTLYSISKDIQIKVINSDKAIEFQVFYGPADYESLNLLSGYRLRNIRKLFNELSIEAQKQAAAKAGKNFSYYKRKLFLVTFQNRGIQ